MKVIGKVSDEHGRALRNVFEVSLSDLILEIEPGTADPTDGIVLKDSTTGTLFTVTVADLITGGGGLTGGQNVGAGAGQVFKDISASDIRLRTLTAGTAINIGTSVDEVSIGVNFASIDHSALGNLNWSASGHTIDTNFLPDSHQTHDLGSASLNWRRLYIGGGTTDGVFIRSNGVAAGGTTPLFQIIGEPSAGPEIVMEQSITWSAGASERYQFTMTGGEFLNNFEWQFTSTPTDMYSAIKPHFLPISDSVYDLGSDGTGVLTIVRRWNNLFLFGRMSSATATLSGLAAGTAANNTLISTRNADGVVEELSYASISAQLNHASLTNLAWSVAGHTIDTNFVPDSDATRSLGTAALRWTNLFLSGSILDASSNQIYLRRSGADTLTGNWTAGAFSITADKFIVSETDVASTKDNYLTQFNINANANDVGTVYQGMFIDIDYNQNNAAAAHLSTVRGLNIDIDLTHTATAFSGMTAQFIKGTIDSAANVAISDRLLDMQATINSTSYAAATSGAYLMSVSAASGSNVICLKTEAKNSGAGRAEGYQGAGTALAGSTGEIIGVEGFITSVGTVARVIALLGSPRAGGGVLPTNDKVIGVKSAAGHLLVTSASGAFVTGTPNDLSTVSTTHLSFTANTGELYVQGAAEFDGKVWLDGDAEFADAKNLILATTTGTKIGTATTQKLGFWNVTPVVQPSAFTQTYATATKTHANLTSATLTDSTGGTANTTCVAIAGTGDDANINNNFADIIAQVNALRVDVENAKQVLNAVIDDDQSIGIKS